MQTIDNSGKRQFELMLCRMCEQSEMFLGLFGTSLSGVGHRQHRTHSELR